MLQSSHLAILAVQASWQVWTFGLDTNPATARFIPEVLKRVEDFQRRNL